MDKKKPYNKEGQVKISFSDLMELIGKTCDYKFSIIDETIDEELTKQIGDTYYYVEEIRKKNKSLAFKSLMKRKLKDPST